MLTAAAMMYREYCSSTARYHTSLPRYHTSLACELLQHVICEINDRNLFFLSGTGTMKMDIVMHAVVGPWEARPPSSLINE